MIDSVIKRKSFGSSMESRSRECGKGLRAGGREKWEEAVTVS